MGHADEGHRPDGLDDRPGLRDRLRKARPQQAPREADDRSFRQAEAQRTAIEFVLVVIASVAKQSSLSVLQDGLLRCARNNREGVAWVLTNQRHASRSSHSASRTS